MAEEKQIESNVSTAITNEAPYWDDFLTEDAAGKTPHDKNFLRILFKPGSSIQARELNQLQTALQSQIDKLGRGIYKNNTRVLGGEISSDHGLKSINITVGANVSFDELNELQVLIGQEIGNNGTFANSTVKAYVVGVKELTNTEFKLYLRYTKANIGTAVDDSTTNATTHTVTAGGNSASSQLTTTREFVSGTDTIYDDSGAVIGTVSDTGKAARFSLSEGVFYTKGSFVYKAADEIFLNLPETATGFSFYDGQLVLRVNEVRYSASDAAGVIQDNTLFDNSVEGNANQGAPGADRYSIDLEMIILSDTDAIQGSENANIVKPYLSFGEETIKLLDIKDNEPSGIQVSNYSKIGDFIEKRTFEESGNYALRPFKVRAIEHLKDTTNPKLANGKFFAPKGDVSKYVLEIDPSVAYVAGRRIALTEKAFVESDKPRKINPNTASVKFQATTGNYIEANMIKGVFDPSVTYNLYVTKSNHALTNDLQFQSPFDSTNGQANANRIGTCKVTTVDFDGSKFRVYLNTISMNSGFRLSDAHFLGTVADNATDFTADAGHTGEGFVLKEVDKNRKVFPTGKYGTTNVSNVKYVIRQAQTMHDVGANKDNGGAGHELRVSSGELFSTNPNDYILIDRTDGSFQALQPGADVKINSSTSVGLFTQNNLSSSTAGNFSCIFPVRTTGTSVAIPVTKNQTFAIPAAEYKNGDTVTLGSGDGKIHELNSIVNGSGADRTNDWEIDLNENDEGLDKAPVLIYRGPDLTGSTTAFTMNYDKYTITPGVNHIGSYKVNDSLFTSLSNSGALIDYGSIHMHNNEFSLGDAIDLRNLGISDTLDPNGEISADIDFINARIDCLILTKEGTFKLIEGQPAEHPTPPPHPTSSLKIANIYLPPYISDIENIGIEYVYHRRYTMTDINKLEDRISNLEYYTSLTALENEAANTQIIDGDGLRFRNGIMTDAFVGHNVANVFDSGYRIAMDTQLGELRPLYSQENHKIKARDTGEGRVPGDKFAPAGTEALKTALAEPSSRLKAFAKKPLLTQPYASVSVNVNPYAISAYIGEIELSPSSDEWKDVRTRPDVIVDIDGNYDTLVHMLKQDEAYGTLWGEAKTHWTGAYTYQYTTTKKKKNGIFKKTKTHYHHHEAQIKTGYKTIDGVETYVKTGTNLEEIGDYIVDLSWVPNVRSRRVYFAADNLKPNTRHIPYLDDVDISLYTVSIGTLSGGIYDRATYNTNRYPDNTDTKAYDPSDYGVEVANTTSVPSPGAIVTDNAGSAYGYFVIPNNDSLRFKCGELTFMLLDSVTPDINNGDSYGKVNYMAQGLIETRERSFASTKTAELAVRAADTLYEYGWKLDTRNNREYRDPLAQSFLIGKYETGVFVSDIDLYFDTKDTSIPVNVYIVTVENGIPTQTVIPYSRVVKAFSEVNADPTGNTATNFKFAQPVYLQPSVEYAIVVASNATGNGEDILGADGNPVHGSTGYKLWVAEVGGTDIVNSNHVIKKNPYAGVFFKSQNASTWTEDQNKDFKFTLNHLEFTEATTPDGVKTQQDFTYDVILPADSGGTTRTASTGTPLLHKAKPVTGFMILATELNLPETSIEYKVDFQQGGTSESHTVKANEIIELDNAFTLASDGGAISNITLRAILTTTSKFVTPMISLDRFSLVTFANDFSLLQKIHDASTTDEELDKYGGSSCTARYITKQIKLNNRSTRLDVYAKVKRPTSTDIRAYVRFHGGAAQSQSPGSTTFNYERLNSAPIPFNDTDEFAEVHFIKDFYAEAGLNSPNTAGIGTVKDFDSFQLKLCLGGDPSAVSTVNTAKVPKVKQLRAIATA